MKRASPSGRHATILVVEDEPIVRFHIVDIVETAGFEVVEAANADTAVRILAERPDIAVMVTDIDMPGSMDGIKLARAVRDRWPPIEIIVMSGAREPAGEDLPARGLFFSKPINEQRFVRALADFANA